MKNYFKIYCIFSGLLISALIQNPTTLNAEPVQGNAIHDGSSEKRSISPELSSPVPSISEASAAPLLPGNITGPNSLCKGTVGNYSITAVSGLTYNWSCAGGTIVGQGTPNVSITFNSTTATTVYVNVSNESGVSPISVMGVTVNQPARIVVQPSSVTVAPGVPAMVGLKAEGSGLRYQWEQTFQDLPSKISPQSSQSGHMYTGEQGSEINNGSIRCIISGTCTSSLVSNSVWLSVVSNPMPGVFISEYVEGSSYNKAIEITNRSSVAVDLSRLRLEKDQDGNGVFSASLILSGLVQPGASYVVANSRASSAILQVANATYNHTVLDFNGDDQLRLTCSGVVIDAVGGPIGGNFGKDVTMVMNPYLQDRDAERWILFPCDYFLHLGHYTDVANTHGVFISEYVESSGFDKALEIYNWTNQPVDLKLFALQKDQDGNGKFGVAFPLQGILQPKGVIVVANVNGSAAITAKANLHTSTATLNFNGNDVIRLLNDGVEVDRLGNAQWQNFGEKKTLVRRPEIIDGFTDVRELKDQWITFPIGDIRHLGWHNARETNAYIAPTPSATQNYVMESTYNVPLLCEALNERATIDILGQGDIGNKISYYDGLGRPTQEVVYQLTPSGADIIQPITYDDYGREALKYLPYAGVGSGAFHPNSINEQKQFYNTASEIAHDNFAYAETEFEASPLSRVTRTYAPGGKWARESENFPTLYAYGSNSSNEIPSLVVLDNGSLSVAGYYDPNTLYLSTTQDGATEAGVLYSGLKGGLTMEWKDKLGRVVMRKSLLNAGRRYPPAPPGQPQRPNVPATFAITLYAYDGYGRLRWVVPPLAAKDIAVGQVVAPDSPTASTLCYQYLYDSKGRLIQKQLPGVAPLLMVYDICNRLVLSQDGEQQKLDLWSFTRYDVLGRPALVGEVAIPTQTQTQATLQAYFSVSREPVSRNAAKPLGYDFAAGFPVTITDADMLTVTYYDNYQHLALAPFTDLGFDATLADADAYTGADGTSSNYFNRVKGFTTGTLAKVLDGSEHAPNAQWMGTATYYDHKYRPIQQRAALYGSEKPTQTIATKYRFSGLIDETTEVLRYSGKQQEQRVVTRYDHAGRPTQTELKMDGGTAQPMASLRYNELGQLASKSYGGGLEEASYNYNIRGWLSTINDPANTASGSYAQSMEYNQQGNVSSLSWITPKDLVNSGLQQYSYTYDKLGRLTSGLYNQPSVPSLLNAYNEQLTYDLNGNILSLNRNGLGGGAPQLIDQLSYGYTGNKLTGVTDNAPAYVGLGYVDGLKATVDREYDAIGRMNKDMDRSITVGYNQLSLPNQVTSLTNGTEKIRYIYDASGRKLAACRDISGATVFTQRYIGSAVVENSGGVEKLNYRITPEGRWVANGTSFRQEFFLKDHLGSVRAIVGRNSSGNKDLVATNRYYPFGLEIAENAPTGVPNPLRYNGKELQTLMQVAGRSLEWYDYGARFYEPAIGRWQTVDPMAEKYLSQSTYHFSGNNPLRFVDSNGMWYEGGFEEAPPGWGDDNYTTNNNGPGDPNKPDDKTAQISLLDYVLQYWINNAEQTGRNILAMGGVKGASKNDNIVAGVNGYAMVFLLSFHMLLEKPQAGNSTKYDGQTNFVEAINTTPKSLPIAINSVLKLESSPWEVLGNAYKAVKEVTVQIKNSELLQKLNATSRGDWVKVYEAGIKDGSKMETHYFRNNNTREVFDVKIKYDHWHQKAFNRKE